MDIYLLGIIISAAVFVTCSVMYFSRKPNVQAVSQAQLIKRAPFSFAPFGYIESRTIKTWGGKETELYENSYYLVVGNDEPNAKNLKKVQVRITGYELPTQAVLIGPAGGTETDLRHGEFAFFKIGRVITKALKGPTKGSVTMDDKELSQYEHNAGRLDTLSFEIWSHEQKRQFGLSGMRIEGKAPPVWLLGALISADETKSAQVTLKIDFGNDRTLVTVEGAQ